MFYACSIVCIYVYSEVFVSLQYPEWYCIHVFPLHIDEGFKNHVATYSSVGHCWEIINKIIKAGSPMRWLCGMQWILEQLREYFFKHFILVKSLLTSNLKNFDPNMCHLTDLISFWFACSDANAQSVSGQVTDTSINLSKRKVGDRMLQGGDALAISATSTSAL